MSPLVCEICGGPGGDGELRLGRMDMSINDQEIAHEKCWQRDPECKCWTALDACICDPSLTANVKNAQCPQHGILAFMRGADVWGEGVPEGVPPMPDGFNDRTAWDAIHWRFSDDGSLLDEAVLVWQRDNQERVRAAMEASDA